MKRSELKQIIKEIISEKDLFLYKIKKGGVYYLDTKSKNKMQIGKAGIWRKGTKVNVEDIKCNSKNCQVLIRMPNGNNDWISSEYLTDKQIVEENFN